MAVQFDLKKGLVKLGGYGVVFAGIMIYYLMFLNHTSNDVQNIMWAGILLGITYLLHACSFTINHQVVKVILSVLLVLMVPVLLVTFVWGYFYGWQQGTIDIVGINAMFIYILVFVILAISGNVRVSLISTTVINWILYLIFDVVEILRKTPVVPSDLYCIKTAAAVVGNYTFYVSSELILATVAMAFIIMLSMKIPYEHKLETKVIKHSKVIFRIVPLVAAIILGIVISNFEYTDFDNDNFDTARMNEIDGTILTFYINYMKMQIEEPDGYSAKYAKELLDRYTDNTIEGTFKPNVIVVMDEAFSDLSLIGDLKTDKDPLEYCHSLKNDAFTRKGWLNVSVWGGSTCNTEFEFLSGNSLYLLPPGSIPYMQYVSENTDSLCNYFHRLGYKNTAIHPYWGQCWRRDTNYENFGFDEFIDAEDFDAQSSTKKISEIKIHDGCDFGDLDYVRDYISDKESFRMIRKQLEEKKPGESMFIFNVTMQNHGGYLYDGDNFKNTIDSTACYSSRLDQYLSLVDRTDDAIKELMEFVRNYEEPTILLIFGDHQPGLERSVYETLYKDKLENLTSDLAAKRYTVPYFICSNYELEDVEYPETSPNFLSMILKETGKLPFDSWDMFRKEVQKEYPVMTGRGIKPKDDIFRGRGAVSDKILDEYNVLEYYNIFAKKQK